MAEPGLTWNGEAVKARVRGAQIAGINKTMGACVVDAKNSHTWQNRTGVLEGGIGIAEYAAAEGDGVKGVWGVQDVRYALIQELGGTVRPVTAKALAFTLPDGTMRFAQSVTIPPCPYLRPAADLQYPFLADHIQAAYDKQGAGDA